MESPFRDPIPDGTRLIETFAWRPDAPVARLDLHLARLERSARALGYPFSKQAVRDTITALAGNTALRCRLTLDQTGAVEITTAPLPPASTTPWVFRFHEIRLNADNPYLRHKTTQRALYDDTRAALPEGVQEWLFLNDRDEVCEGTITNIAVITEEGDTLTPPVSSGCLPGVFRQAMLDAGHWREAVMTPADLLDASNIVLTNALRGEIATVWDRTCPMYQAALSRR